MEADDDKQSRAGNKADSYLGHTKQDRLDTLLASEEGDTLLVSGEGDTLSAPEEGDKENVDPEKGSGQEEEEMQVGGGEKSPRTEVSLAQFIFKSTGT